MNICIVTPDYPSKKSYAFSFVKQLVDEFAHQGHDCYVLSPFSITRYKCFNRIIEEELFEKGGKVTIIRPYFLSFSSIKVGSFSFTEIFYNRALTKAFSLLPVKPDVIYSHFWISACATYKYAQKNNIPLFVASGESYILNIKDTTSLRKCVSGVICVSEKNKKESIKMGLTTRDKCIVIPNAINKSVFYKMDKIKVRRMYGISEDSFVVAYVGVFSQRKGSKRLSEALKKIDNPNVFSVFIGDGPEEPVCKNILFKGKVVHEQICPFLNCADVFVLPTLAEGCCNAIIEAMACGLPIVSSDCDFNDGILDDYSSIRVNPNSIEQIADAIKRLYDDKDLRQSMSQAALAKAAELTIDKRATAILEFINNNITK